MGTWREPPRSCRQYLRTCAYVGKPPKALRFTGANRAPRSKALGSTVKHRFASGATALLDGPSTRRSAKRRPVRDYMSLRQLARSSRIRALNVSRPGYTSCRRFARLSRLGEGAAVGAAPSRVPVSYGFLSSEDPSCYSASNSQSREPAMQLLEAFDPDLGGKSEAPHRSAGRLV
jgi:hypothetical protein